MNRPIKVDVGLGITHILDLKILENQCAIGVNPAVWGLMEEVLTTVPCFAVQPGKLTLGTIAPMAATIAARELFVGLLDLCSSLVR